MIETYYGLMRRQGISRRSFLKFCSLTAASLGLGDAGAQQIAKAMEIKPRTPVVWLHGLECTCCSEAFIRSAHPLTKDVVLSMLSLDYDDTLMAAAGYQAEQQLEDTITQVQGQLHPRLRRQPAARRRRHLLHSRRQAVRREARRVAADCKAIISWGSCASWGCVQAAKPNPTQATPIHKVITDKPIVKVPGCPPIPEVMTGVVTYILTFDRLPDLDAQGRPKMFYGQRVHDKCYRRPHFDAGQFAERFDDEGARMGYCLYKVGCKGPVTYNACSATRWNEGVSFPIQSGHGCIGCSEDAFWDKGSFYDHLTTIRPPGHIRHRGHRRPDRTWPRRCRRRRHRGARGDQRHQAGAQQEPQRQGQRGGGIVMAAYQTQGFTLDNSGKRIVVDPITRIEGHLRIEVNVDKDNVIRNAVSTGTMWRGLEVILKGRDPRDAWAFAERICGVCTGVHALASVRAVEDAIGIKIPKNANIIRNLMHATLYAQDHLVHFYHLHALDWVDVVSALKADPEAAPRRSSRASRAIRIPRQAISARCRIG